VPLLDTHPPRAPKLLLEGGVDVNAVDGGLKTPLHWACFFGSTELASIFIRPGAEVDARDHEVETPILFAASAGHAALTKILLDAGADPTVRNEGAAV